MIHGGSVIPLFGQPVNTWRFIDPLLSPPYHVFDFINLDFQNDITNFIIQKAWCHLLVRYLGRKNFAFYSKPRELKSIKDTLGGPAPGRVREGDWLGKVRLVGNFFL